MRLYREIFIFICVLMHFRQAELEMSSENIGRLLMFASVRNATGGQICLVHGIPGQNQSKGSGTVEQWTWMLFKLMSGQHNYPNLFNSLALRHAVPSLAMILQLFYQKHHLYQ